MKKVAVIGGAAYVGQFLLPLLQAEDYDLLAVTRHNGPLLLNRFGICVKKGYELSADDAADVVINLAYSRSYDAKENQKENLEIMHGISRLAKPGSRIIHLSTLGVFGFCLERAQHQDRLARKKDYLYIESKTEMEHLLLDRFGQQDLHIVRCGNIFGPGSAEWTAGIADALFYGQPLLPEPAGFSNITDVHNLVSYLSFLTAKGSRQQFHHMAELGMISWDEIIRFMADALKTEAMPAGPIPLYSIHAWGELQQLFHIRPDIFLKRLSRSRFFHEQARSLIALIPSSFKKAVQKDRPAPAVARPIAIGPLRSWILSGPVLFKHEADPEWKTPLDKEASFEKVRKWLTFAGYTSQDP